MALRRAVVSYPVDADNTQKKRVLLNGLREIAGELVELDCKDECVRELEQVANDVECGDV